jgi:hypothetical protein
MSATRYVAHLSAQGLAKPIEFTRRIARRIGFAAGR